MQPNIWWLFHHLDTSRINVSDDSPNSGERTSVIGIASNFIVLIDL